MVVKMKYISRRISVTNQHGIEVEYADADFFRISTPLVVLGEPGAGKSELLRFASEQFNTQIYNASTIDALPALDEQSNLIIVDGIDELGVLLFGHDNNAYWYGSQLSIEETRDLAPYQNATGLQVSSAALAGMVWALENPEAGIVEADEVDYKRCLEVQLPYLGPVKGYYTDWTPLDGRPGLFPEDIDESDPWQFRNILVR